MWYPAVLVVAERSLLAMVNAVLNCANVLSFLGRARHSRQGSSKRPVSKMILYTIRTAVLSSIGDSPAMAKSIPSSICWKSVSMGVVGCHGLDMVVRLLSKSSGLISP